MSNKAPAFQTYAADYYMDTADWTVEEMGIYQRLLLNQWTNIDLPSEQDRLARIAGCSLLKLKKAWGIISKKFQVLESGRLQNLRLEEERQKQVKYSESRKEQAEKRWNKQDAHASAHAMHSECTGDALQSSSSSSSSLEPTNLKEEDSKPYVGKPTPEGPKYPPPQRLIIPPKIEWVREYCHERNKGIDPDAWFDHYQTRGWKVVSGKGSVPMKDWQSAVRTWERNRRNNGVQVPLVTKKTEGNWALLKAIQDGDIEPMGGYDDKN